MLKTGRTRKCQYKRNLFTTLEFQIAYLSKIWTAYMKLHNDRRHLENLNMVPNDQPNPS